MKNLNSLVFLQDNGLMIVTALFALCLAALAIYLLTNKGRPAVKSAKEDVLIPRISSRRERLKRAPGNRLMSIVRFLYSPADIEKTFESTLADWHKEYFEALATHQLWKGRWINVRYRYRFACAMGLNKAWRLFDVAIKAVTSAISK